MSQPSMKGYFVFPPPNTTVTTNASLQPSNVESAGTCTTRCNHLADASNGNVSQSMDDARQKRREQERALGEQSEVEWVRAGGVLRDASGRRDKARTERIRQELDLRELERQKVARWEAYEARWRAILSSAGPVTFLDFPWPLAERVVPRGLSSLTPGAISEFLFESLAVRTNTTTRRERIRSALLRWHPDKISFVLARVAPDDLELVREGIHTVFGILRNLQDKERTGSRVPSR